MFNSNPVPSVFFALRWEGGPLSHLVQRGKLADCCRIQLSLQSRNTKLSFLWSVEIYGCSCSNFCSLEWAFSFLVLLLLFWFSSDPEAAPSQFSYTHQPQSIFCSLFPATSSPSFNKATAESHAKPSSAYLSIHSIWSGDWVGSRPLWNSCTTWVKSRAENVKGSFQAQLPTSTLITQLFNTAYVTKTIISLLLQKIDAQAIEEFYGLTSDISKNSESGYILFYQSRDWTGPRWIPNRLSLMQRGEARMAATGSAQ